MNIEQIIIIIPNNNNNNCKIIIIIINQDIVLHCPKGKLGPFSQPLLFLFVANI